MRCTIFVLFGCLVITICMSTYFIYHPNKACTVSLIRPSANDPHRTTIKASTVVQDNTQDDKSVAEHITEAYTLGIIK